MHETKCPACGSPEHYRLKDGRLQCSGCRKKYTAQKQRCKLSEKTLQQTVQSFWRMIPASALALELKVNCKTLQKYYDQLRRAIAAFNERHALVLFGAMNANPELFHEMARQKGLGTDAKPLFCLVHKKEKAYLLLAEESEGNFADITIPDIAGWIYAQDRRAHSSLDLDRIHFLTAITGKEGRSEANFWITAKRGLVKYHGGFRRNFYLFMQEMEFRFNNHNEDLAHSFLLNILQNNKTIETGDENVQV